MDESNLQTGDFLEDAILRHGIPQCSLFFAYLTRNYLDSTWCMKELELAMQVRRAVVAVFADSAELRTQVPPAIRDTLHLGLMTPETYTEALVELIGKAWESLQSTRRLVRSEDHLLAGPGIFDMDGYRREQLLSRVKKHLILAGPNLRSWLSDSATKQHLINMVRDTDTTVTVTLILARYETLEVLGGGGAEHLRQSAEDIRGMLNELPDEKRVQLRAYFHTAVTTLSAVFIDPDNPDGILFFNPRWAIQYLPDDRLTCVIDKSINSSSLFKAIYNSVILMTQRDAKTVDQMLT